MRYESSVIHSFTNFQFERVLPLVKEYAVQLQNFSVTRHSGKWWAIKLKVTCLFRF